MTEQSTSPGIKVSAWLRALLSKAPPSVAVGGTRKLPRIADMLATIGREPGQKL